MAIINICWLDSKSDYDYTLFLFYPIDPLDEHNCLENTNKV